MQVSRVSDKIFVGKDILHVAVWKKGDKRTIYHMVYQDGTTGASYMKRFNVTSITREKEYPLTKGTKGSKVHYFTANPNGESEVVQVALRPRPNIKKLKFDIDFGELIVKGRNSAGNRSTKYLISKVTQKEQGDSTLSARKLWYDDIVRKLNVEGRGEFLGEFRGDDRIMMITQAGEYRLYPFALNIHFADDMIHIEKWNPEKPLSVIYWDGEKENYYVKRFLLEDSSSTVVFISEHPKSFLEIASTDWKPMVNLQYDGRANKREDEEVNVEEFIAIKGMKALGNRLTTYKLKSIDVLDPIPYEPEPVKEEPKEVEVESTGENELEEPIIVEEDEEIEEPSSPPKSSDDGGQASLF